MPHILFVREVFSWTGTHPLGLALLFSKLWGATWLHNPALDYICASQCLAFYVCAEDPTSGSHVYATSPSPTEPCPQPPLHGQGCGFSWAHFLQEGLGTCFECCSFSPAQERGWDEEAATFLEDSVSLMLFPVLHLNLFMVPWNHLSFSGWLSVVSLSRLRVITRACALCASLTTYLVPFPP